MELKYHAKQSVLRFEFGSATSVVEGVHGKVGILKPLPAMTLQNVTVILDEVSLMDLTDDQVLYFAVVLTDEVGNRGHLSNFAEARFTRRGRDLVLEEKIASNLKGIVVVGVLGAIVLLAFLLIGIANCKRDGDKDKLINNSDVSTTYVADYYVKYSTQPRQSHDPTNHGTYPRKTPKNGSRFGSLQRSSANWSDKSKVSDGKSQTCPDNNSGNDRSSSATCSSLLDSMGTSTSSFRPDA